MNISEFPINRQDVLSIGREANRSHFVPYADRAEAEAGQGARPRRVDGLGAIPPCSSRYMDLNGLWDFEWFDSYVKVPAELLRGRAFDGRQIRVPLNWQFAGFGKIHYSDEHYPFPVDPPNVPQLNETGVYHRTVSLKPQPGMEYFLNFEGVESAFAVYLNGQFVGFNQGSRMHSEFRLSALQETNDLTIVVSQYSSATYIEDQDEWWLGGIIRDVYLLARPEGHYLRNIRLDTGFSEETGELVLRADLAADGDRLHILVEDEGRQLTDVVLDAGQREASITLEGVQAWSAETPKLYTVYVEVLNGEEVTEAVVLRAGFRSLEIRDGVLLWNGRRILMKGVNRHEFSAVSGRAISYEQTRRELLLIKEGGMNAVRCAHYPNNPYFYDLCDEIGLYVIDEADLETNYFVLVQDRARLADDRSWRQAYLDRVIRMVERDRNHVSIAAWSLGNEADYGSNFVYMYEWVKANEPLRPVHYEGDRYNRSVDVSSSMYSNLERLHNLDRNVEVNMPHILCEFGHAMGNGPGGLQDYFELIEHSRRVQGCFVWEFKDHGITRVLGPEQPEADWPGPAPDAGEYLYGGDFGEKYHNGNFCMDGLLRSTGEPTQGWREWVKVIENARIIDFDAEANTVSVLNRYDFLDLAGAELSARILVNDRPVQAWEQQLPGIRPGETAVVRLAEEADWQALLRQGGGRPAGEEDLYSLELTVSREADLLGDSVVLQAGSFAATLEAPDRDEPEQPEEAVTISEGSVLCQETNAYYEISAGQARLQVSKADGRIYHYEVDGHELIEQGPRLNFYRAYTDNDARMSKTWDEAHLNTGSFTIYGQSGSWTEDGSLKISFTGRYAPDSVSWGCRTELTYLVSPSGAVKVQFEGVFDGQGVPEHLPRIGSQLVLAADLSEVTYRGLGPDENYSDSRAAARPGVWRTTAADLQTHYDVPQEYGNRGEVRWLSVTDGAGGLVFSAEDVLDMSIHNVSDDSLQAARHRSELVPEVRWYLNLDYRNSGLGSASCGPERTEEHQVKPENFSFSYTISPILVKNMTWLEGNI